MTEAASYRIPTEVPSSFMEKLLDFVHKQYLVPQKQRFGGFSREARDGVAFLSYNVLDSQGSPLVQVEVKGSKPLELRVTPISGPVTAQVMEEAKQDIVIAVEMFEQNARKKTFYFAWREGEEIVPEELRKQEKSFNRLFLETQILFFVVFITLGMVLFIVIAAVYPDASWIAPIILIAVQFVFVFFSASFIARAADWRITEANPIIHFLEYHLPIGEHDDFKQTYSRDQLLTIKKDVYDEILARRGEIDCEAAPKTFPEPGGPC